jgi:hypothetical protein
VGDAESGLYPGSVFVLVLELIIIFGIAVSGGEKYWCNLYSKVTVKVFFEVTYVTVNGSLQLTVRLLLMTGVNEVLDESSYLK